MGVRGRVMGVRGRVMGVGGRVMGVGGLFSEDVEHDPRSEVELVQ